eukprot:TRINITY_DN3742_c0_g1_i2.p1 TRINITY_DN3742_c0_g1~~TRINITY_DN3742_c0_g1_i2.p1  ORF type:complete len:134 (-),score=21.56 TRINITY_DN3742_c0_g1_i2:265-666(-)
MQARYPEELFSQYNCTQLIQLHNQDRLKPPPLNKRQRKHLFLQKEVLVDSLSDYVYDSGVKNMVSMLSRPLLEGLTENLSSEVLGRGRKLGSRVLKKRVVDLMKYHGCAGYFIDFVDGSYTLVVFEFFSFLMF